MLRSALDRSQRKVASQEDSLSDLLTGENRLYWVSRTHIDIESTLRLAKQYELSPIIIGGDESYMVAEELAESQVPVILSPLSLSIYGQEGSELAWNHAGLLKKAGIQFAFSGNDLLEQARFAIRFGLDPDTALRAITSIPAGLMGLEARIGSLTPGKDADFVVLSGEPFEFTTDVKSVFINGQMYQEAIEP